MVTRRDFLKTMSMASAGLALTRPAAERRARGITTSEIRKAAPMALPGL